MYKIYLAYVLARGLLLLPQTVASIVVTFPDRPHALVTNCPKVYLNHTA